jgi:hypothetical protein
MNDRAERGMLELKMDVAQMYTIHKGRMPHDVHELREWLREFADLESKRADLTLRAYEQHMAVCNRPWLIQGGLR